MTRPGDTSFARAKLSRVMYFRVTATGTRSAGPQDDIAIQASSASEALETAQNRLDEAYGAGKIGVSVKRISKAVAADIVDSGGIDWLHH